MKIVFLFLSFLWYDACVWAQGFEEWFQDRTLRLDYTFSGDNRNQYIFLDEMKWSDHWYGRRVNMDSLLLQGNGQLCVKDSKSSRVLYQY